jgi:prepilin-type N-terminal cleavage/methylation domain-containing protein
VRSERGFTLIEILIALGIMAVIAAMAVSQLIRARASANEASAIASLRAIGSGQIAYANSCGRGAFAIQLPTLAQPMPGTTMGFLSPDLTSAPSVMKSGYTTTMAAGAGAVNAEPDCNGTATQTGYYASAVPNLYGLHGLRSFGMGAAGVIWQEYAATAPAEPFGAPATPIR